MSETDSAARTQAMDARERLLGLRRHLASELIGYETLIDRLLIALLCGGHVLLEGAPGLAKTRTVRAFAAALDVDFVRIQATPDLLPADLIGTDVFQPASGDFRFVPGPLFHHVVLVDEINRAPPKVQSALLEAMGEQQISSGGVTRVLEQPFLVAATQNPIEHEGTYPLPEAQLDRFLFLVNLSLPDAARERRILDHIIAERRDALDTTSLTPRTTIGVTVDTVLAARAAVAGQHVADAIRDYVVRLVMATRGEGEGAVPAGVIAHPASPRGSLYLCHAAQAAAWLDGRDYTTPDDVASLAADVLTGRVSLGYQARAEGLQARTLIEQLVHTVPRP